MFQLLTSSVGKKFLVGLSGFLVSGFALTHMAANLLLIFSPDGYNLYGHAITSAPWYYAAEAFLVLIFVGHLALALNLAASNRAARQVRPSFPPDGEKAARFGSRWMALSGLLLLAFLALHLYSFRFGAYYPTELNGVVVRDLYTLAVEKFQDPLFVGFYGISLLTLGLHLNHGIASIFQSLGVSSAQVPWLSRAGYAFAWVLAAGFMAPPIYIFFFMEK